MSPGDRFDSGEEPTAAELLDRVNADDLPGLAGFLGGYLHDDWQLDYPSAAAAAWAFIAQADLEDVQELAGDWSVLSEATRDLDLASVNRLLRERFRSGWHLLSKDEIQAVAQELERAQRE